MIEELIQNDKSICIKRTIPLFKKEEIDNINENFIDIVNEYSKMLVKDKEQKTIQLLMKRQNEEIERLHSIIKEVREYIEELAEDTEDYIGAIDRRRKVELLEILDKVEESK